MTLVAPVATMMAKSPQSLKYSLENLKDVHIGAAPVGTELEQLFQKRYPWIQIRQSNSNINFLSCYFVTDFNVANLRRYGRQILEKIGINRRLAF